MNNKKMTLENKITKTLKGVGTGLALLAAVAGGCAGGSGSGGGKDTSPKYDVTAEADFGNGYSGNVQWNIMTEGETPAEYVDVSINGGNTERYVNAAEANPFELGYIAEIQEGPNTIMARYDGGTAEEEFVPASEEEAEAVMENYFITNGIDYEKNTPFEITSPEGCEGIFEVDFYTESGDILEYISHSENLQEKLDNKDKLDCAGEPNRTFTYLPEAELVKRVQNFLE